MCVVSMITEYYRDKWYPYVPQPLYPQYYPQDYPSQQDTTDTQKWKNLFNPQPPQPPSISPEEVKEFRRLLDRAREYDKRNGEPACEQAEKVAALKAIAKALELDISFIDDPDAAQVIQAGGGTAKGPEPATLPPTANDVIVAVDAYDATSMASEPMI